MAKKVGPGAGDSQWWRGAEEARALLLHEAPWVLDEEYLLRLVVGDSRDLAMRLDRIGGLVDDLRNVTSRNVPVVEALRRELPPLLRAGVLKNPKTRSTAPPLCEDLLALLDVLDRLPARLAVVRGPFGTAEYDDRAEVTEGLRYVAERDGRHRPSVRVLAAVGVWLGIDKPSDGRALIADRWKSATKENRRRRSGR